MLKPAYTNRFHKDLKLMIKRGKDAEKLKAVVRKLLAGLPLNPRHRDHKLAGNYVDHRECHIEPDWLLIYLPVPAEETLIFTRTGTHSDLFK